MYERANLKGFMGDTSRNYSTVGFYSVFPTFDFLSVRLTSAMIFLPKTPLRIISWAVDWFVSREKANLMRMNQNETMDHSCMFNIRNKPLTGAFTREYGVVGSIPQRVHLIKRSDQIFPTYKYHQIKPNPVTLELTSE